MLKIQQLIKKIPKFKLYELKTFHTINDYEKIFSSLTTQYLV